MSQSEELDLVKKVQTTCPLCGERTVGWDFVIIGYWSPEEVWYGACGCKIYGFEEGLAALGIPKEEWCQY